MYDSSKAEIKSKTSVIICHDKIFVHSKTTVIQTDKVNANVYNQHDPK
jgi:hypothetical protein